MGNVGVLLDRTLIQRLIEARPTRPGFIFRLRAEKRLPAAHAGVSPGIFGLVILAGESWFSASFAGDEELLRREFLLPIGFSFLDLVLHMPLIIPELERQDRCLPLSVQQRFI